MPKRHVIPRSLLWFTLLLALLIVFVPAAAAQDSTRTVTDDEVNDVAKDVFCPVCENTPLDVCPTQACADWRDLIREKLVAGQSKNEIFDYFARQYGDGVLANPPRRGFNLILWFFPVAAVLLGGVFFGRYVTQLRAETTAAEDEADAVISKGSAIKEPAPTQSLDDYRSRVEEELKSA